MTELEVLQTIAGNAQALIELCSFTAGLLCVLLTAITWKG